MLSSHYKEIYDEINKEKIDSKYVFDLVHEYLIHSGYVGTLKAFEDESSFALIRKEKEEDEVNEFEKLNNKTPNPKQRKKTLGPELLNLTSKSIPISQGTLEKSDKGKSEKKIEIENKIEEVAQEVDGNERVEESKEHPNEGIKEPISLQKQEGKLH